MATGSLSYKNIYQKLFKCQEALKVVFKNKFNSHKNTDYVSSEDVIFYGSQALRDQKLTLIRKNYKYSQKSSGTQDRILVSKFVVIDMESDEELEIIAEYPIPSNNGMSEADEAQTALTRCLSNCYRDLLQIAKYTREELAQKVQRGLISSNREPIKIVNSEIVDTIDAEIQKNKLLKGKKTA